MFENIDAVIFDLDGTVVDSMWMWEAIDIEYFARFGIPFTHQYQMEIAGMSFHETAIYFKKTFGIPDSIEKMKSDWHEMAWDKYANEVYPKPGVVDLLKKLNEKNVPCAIATSNSMELCMACLNRHGLAGCFSAIHTANEVGRGKPYPDIYLYVADKLSISPQKCLVFEDLYQGILAGKNAGMKTCAVDDDYSKEYINEKVTAADYHIHDFTDERIQAYVKC